MLNASTPIAAMGKNVLLPLPGGPATTSMTGRAAVFDAATASQPVSTLVNEDGSMSGGSCRDTSCPSRSITPICSSRARA